jgi:GrpB-like predicted nucleotidyltransferase (UPF0157 family)
MDNAASMDNLCWLSFFYSRGEETGFGMPNIVLQPHNPKWQQQFEHEAQALSRALGGLSMIVHHIGSTAIPTVQARPILDILIKVCDLKQLDTHLVQLTKLGYQDLGEHGVPGRRFLIKNDVDGQRVVNLYVFQVGHPEVQTALNFRDYLLTHQEDAKFYNSLKSDLLEKEPDDLVSYTHGKDWFVVEIVHKAAQWRQGDAENPGNNPEA